MATKKKLKVKSEIAKFVKPNDSTTDIFRKAIAAQNKKDNGKIRSRTTS